MTYKNYYINYFMTTDDLRQEPDLIALVLDLLQTDANYRDTFISSFQKFAPEIENEILTASVDPNCSCRHKIHTYVIDNADAIANFINIFCEENEIPEYPDFFFTEKYKRPAFFSGTIKTIPLSGWSDFSKEISSRPTHFRGFSVVEDGDNLRVYFL